MTEIDAATALDEANRLSSRSRRAGRWYLTYLVIFGVASFLLCVGFGLIGGKWGAIVLTPIWGILIVGLSIYAARQRANVVGLSRLHLIMMASWALVWGMTVILGSIFFAQDLAWWLAGGVATALPPLITAWLVHRRTALPGR